MRTIALPATILLLLALGGPPVLAATAPEPLDAAALKRLQVASFEADWKAVVGR